YGVQTMFSHNLAMLSPYPTRSAGWGPPCKTTSGHRPGVGTRPDSSTDNAKYHAELHLPLLRARSIYRQPTATRGSPHQRGSHAYRQKKQSPFPMASPRWSKRGIGGWADYPVDKLTHPTNMPCS